jgi:cytochrome b6-f complex iron-sulfur subunit
MEEQDRRMFLNRTWKALAGLFVLEAAWGSWDMIQPSQARAFGGIIKAGLPSEFAEGTVKYFPNGRFYVAAYKGKLQALYQKCPHLGCRVPFCETSKQFECPCHGSAYNITGEYLQGPAPRGMDRFPLRIEGNQVLVDTGELIEGPPQGVLTGPSEPMGPACNGVFPEHVEDEPPAQEEHFDSEEPSSQEPPPGEHHEEEEDANRDGHQHDHTEEPSPGSGGAMSGGALGGMDVSGVDHTGMDMGGGGQP